MVERASIADLVSNGNNGDTFQGRMLRRQGNGVSIHAVPESEATIDDAAPIVTGQAYPALQSVIVRTAAAGAYADKNGKTAANSASVHVRIPNGDADRVISAAAEITPAEFAFLEIVEGVDNSYRGTLSDDTQLTLILNPIDQDFAIINQRIWTYDVTAVGAETASSKYGNGIADEATAGRWVTQASDSEIVTLNSSFVINTGSEPDKSAATASKNIGDTSSVRYTAARRALIVNRDGRYFINVSLSNFGIGFQGIYIGGILRLFDDTNTQVEEWDFANSLQSDTGIYFNLGSLAKTVTLTQGNYEWEYTSHGLDSGQHSGGNRAALGAVIDVEASLEVATVDSASEWSTTVDYTGDENKAFIYTMPSTLNAGTFTTQNGVEPKAGERRFGFYFMDRTAADSVAVFADDAATIAELALIYDLGGADSAVRGELLSCSNPLNRTDLNTLLGGAPALFDGRNVIVMENDNTLKVESYESNGQVQSSQVITDGFLYINDDTQVLEQVYIPSGAISPVGVKVAVEIWNSNRRYGNGAGRIPMAVGSDGRVYLAQVEAVPLNADPTTDDGNWASAGSANVPTRFYDKTTPGTSDVISDEDQYAILQADGEYTAPAQIQGRRIHIAKTSSGAVTVRGTGAGNLAEWQSDQGTSVDQLLTINREFEFATAIGTTAGPWIVMEGVAEADAVVITDLPATGIVQSNGDNTLTTVTPERLEVNGQVTPSNSGHVPGDTSLTIPSTGRWDIWGECSASGVADADLHLWVRIYIGGGPSGEVRIPVHNGELWHFQVTDFDLALTAGDIVTLRIRVEGSGDQSAAAYTIKARKVLV